MALLDVSEYASRHSDLPYTGLPILAVVVAALCVVAIAGVIWACLALGAVTDRRDGR